MLKALLDLALPRECGGCESPGTLWCERCRLSLAGAPVPIRPRVDPGVPCWALGAYTGPRRGAVLATKDRNRRDLVGPLGTALASAIDHLRVGGHIDPPELAPLVLIPAPSRARAARSRGGDPVLRMVRAAAAASAPEPVSVVQALRMRPGVRDSVGLGAAARVNNVAGRIACRTSIGARASAAPVEQTVLLVDDVLTTGATASESVSVLTGSGVKVGAVLVLAAV